ncbi:MAG: hypothetical protein ABIP12_04050 [Terriglobales bacterium]
MKRIAIFVLAFTMLAFAEGTKSWQQSTFDAFSRGTTKGIAIRSDGSLELAPSFQSLHTSPATYIWSIAADAAGNIFVGTGSPARVYRITPDGKATVIFQPKELQVQSIALDANGVLYAATSPDGMVYKIEKSATGVKDPKAPAVTATPEKTASKADAAKADTAAPKEADKTPVDPSYASAVFFDPKTKYIWSLAFDPDGRLYVATGDRGEVFRVNKDGSNALFFKSDEAHIRSLLVRPDGNVIAGSDGSGLIYRISPSGDGFVLYSANKKEITSLAADRAGNIYAAGVGQKRTGTTTAVSPIMPPPQIGPQPAPAPGTAPIATPPPSSFFASLSSSGGSEVYMIAPDGSPKRLWENRDDIIYALAFDANGRLLAGSGNKGRLVSIANNGDYVDLLKASATQITGFAPAPDGALYLATSNLGKVFSLGAASTEEGVFESEVFDARIFSKWGRVEVEGSGDFEIYGRSGNVDNPDRNWSPWKKVELDKDSMLDAPPARFIQWKMVVPARSNARVKSVKLNYRPKNVAPVIDDIAVQTGARFAQTGSSGPRPTNETIMVGGTQSIMPQFGISPGPRSDPPMPAQKDRSFIAVRWSARDDNDDQLTYSVYYRGDAETRWKLLKDKLTDKLYSWDSGLLPDGGYTLRVVTSDALSNSPDDFLTDSKESVRFEVDNTSPRIDGLNGKLEGDQLHVSFSATDTFSPIQRAEFSIDAGEWRFVEPVGQLSDAKVETYDFTVTVPIIAAAKSTPPEPARNKKKLSAKEKADEAKAAEARAAEARAAEAAATTPGTLELSNEHVVVVRVFDRFDNVSTAKIVVK